MKFKNMDMKIFVFFIKDYKRYIVIIFSLTLLYAIFEGLNVVVLFPLINSLINTVAVAQRETWIIKLLNTLIEVVPIRDTFISACVFIIFVVVIKNIFRYLSMVFNAYASYKIWDDIQKKLFLKYIHADYRYFLDHKQGEIVYRLYNAPAAIGGILQFLPQITAEVLKIIVIGIMLFSMSLPITCGVIVIAVMFYLFTHSISRRVSYSLGKGRVEACEEQNILINEMINGIKQIKVFLGETRWVSNFYRAVDKYFRLAKKDTLWINMPASFLEIFALTTLSAFLIFVRRYSPENLVSNLPLIGVFAYAFQRVMPSLSVITTLRMQIMGSLPILEVIYSVINEEMRYLKDGCKELTGFNTKIEFRNVSFAYPGRSNALKNSTISFEKNNCTAIVGPSGSGKTTVVNLLIRFFDPTEGIIFIDGVDIRDYKRDSWLSKIGFVSQDTFIFHATVSENIAFGFERASKEDIVEACKIANAHDFIIKLPEGYDTIVGERGMKLSGGEQQRIAIARAILRNPQILVFDEATSALDNISQSLIQNAINKIVKDHTVILIAHRLSTIANADKIVVLDRGEIKETGTHFDLIKRKGFYWKLYNNEG